ncbi:MAG: sugar ABC transporter ATP-binding protein [Alphaproteobacteria bacterium]|nr:sugar ABC transporter ATP-binding protein [Alphaproteobacteria bacterium]
MTNNKTPLIEMKNISKRFGGVHAVENVSINLYPGEVVGILGHNGAGKSTLMKMLSGAIEIDEGEIIVNGKKASIKNPRESRALGIETIYQTLALADTLDASANLFLGREITNAFGVLNEAQMELETRKVMKTLNPNFTNITDPVNSMSGGQRQVVAIGRAIYFNAKTLVMDEPTAALGPAETTMVKDLTLRLKTEGIGIFLISHDMGDVFELCDRVMVMKNGKDVGKFDIEEVTRDDILSLIIAGQLPEGWKPRNKK